MTNDSKRQNPWSTPEQLLGHSFFVAKINELIGDDDEEDANASSATLLHGLLASPETPM